MSAHPTIILRTMADRLKAGEWAMNAPAGTVMELRETKRSLPQNARLHAMITTIASEVEWHGQKLSVADWKLLFMDALNRELRVVPNLDGTGFVQLGRRTSRTTVAECGDLMTLVEAFAAKRGVDLARREPLEGV